MWAACCLGFFALLRSGEFTVSSLSQFDPTRHITPMDISVDSHVNPTVMGLTLKFSKTDQTGIGLTLCVGETGTIYSICPVRAMIDYLAYRGVSQGPLFTVVL